LTKPVRTFKLAAHSLIAGLDIQTSAAVATPPAKKTKQTETRLRKNRGRKDISCKNRRIVDLTPVCPPLFSFSFSFVIRRHLGLSHLGQVRFRLRIPLVAAEILANCV